ncbi:MAG: hypothetical protein ACLP59_19085 [Bryobacteraceae bacterium]
MTQSSLAGANGVLPSYVFNLATTCAYGYYLPNGTSGAGCQTQTNGASTDSPVYAEPLWVPSVSTQYCGTVNLVIVRAR